MRPSSTRAWLACSALLTCSGCSIISVQPTWELIKATGSATSYAITGIPPKAVNTIQHPFVRPKSVCIAFNPNVQSMEVVPAIQSALQQRQIESRVFDQVASTPLCSAWLHYAAAIEWGTPPLTSDLRTYISQAWLTLKTDDGRVLASSTMGAGGVWDIGKWASTRDKVDAIVNALLGSPDKRPGA